MPHSSIAACDIVLSITGFATGPLNAGTDGDGLTGDFELTPRTISVNNSRVVVTSNPLSLDSDRDRVNDNIELANGSNPKSANTDGDNQGDFFEIITDRERDPNFTDERITLAYR